MRRHSVESVSRSQLADVPLQALSSRNERSHTVDGAGTSTESIVHDNDSTSSSPLRSRQETNSETPLDSYALTWGPVQFSLALVGVHPLFRAPKSWHPVLQTIVTWWFFGLVMTLYFVRLVRNGSCWMIGERFDADHIIHTILMLTGFVILILTFRLVNLSDFLQTAANLHKEVAIILHPVSKTDADEYNKGYLAYIGRVARANGVFLTAVTFLVWMSPNLNKLLHLKSGSDFDEEIFDLCVDRYFYDNAKVVFLLFLVWTDLIWFLSLACGFMLANVTEHILRRNLKQIRHVTRVLCKSASKETNMFAASRLASFVSSTTAPRVDFVDSDQENEDDDDEDADIQFVNNEHDARLILRQLSSQPSKPRGGITPSLSDQMLSSRLSTSNLLNDQQENRVGLVRSTSLQHAPSLEVPTLSRSDLNAKTSVPSSGPRGSDLATVPISQHGSDAKVIAYIQQFIPELTQLDNRIRFMWTGLIFFTPLSLAWCVSLFIEWYPNADVSVGVLSAFMVPAVTVSVAVVTFHAHRLKTVRLRKKLERIFLTGDEDDTVMGEEKPGWQRTNSFSHKLSKTVNGL